MENQPVAAPSDNSPSPPRRIPASLKITSFLPFARQPQVSSPVKRKPLPPNALSPLSPAHKPLDAAQLNGKINSAGITSPELLVRDLDQFPRGQTPLVEAGPGFSSKATKQNTVELGGNNDITIRPSRPAASPRAERLGEHRRSISMAIQQFSGPPPRPEILTRSFTTNSIDTKAINAPKTPIVGNKLTTFFGWKNTSPGGESSSTEISDGQSAYPSPILPSPQTSAYSNRSIPPAIDISKANAFAMGATARTPGLLAPLPISDSDLATKVAMLEGELTEISSELAGSIKREMELEDMVESLQMENPTAPILNNRTSDYFSDYSSSSVRDGVPKPEDLEKVKRKSEQERAQLKVSLSQKWQDERSKRKALESHVQLLEEQLSQSRRERTDISTISTKAKELEASLDDARRRLLEERRIKENFEDLLTALRVDLEQHRNERDNLRDEVVPQLKVQLENANDSSYDFRRMQQEISALKIQNTTLVNARKIQLEMQQNAARFNTISEEGSTSPQSPVGLTRSNSLARAPIRGGNGAIARSPSLSRGSVSRSNSVSGRSQESRESLLERVKDVEAQRDALHSAVKSLLDRQSYQTRENAKRLKMLELERDRALHNSSPRKLGYEKEVQTLREEINQLRKRADDALVQKWQCEKGLGGLKMDLDRAQQETSSLRTLLQEHDISIPEELSSSLQEAYSQLQQDRQQAESRKNNFRSLEEEQRLADQLRTSAERSESLASQVRQQLYTNQGLRDRLAEAVARGESNQQTSANRITEMQAKLRKLEETVTAAQQQTETAVMSHEDQVRGIKQNDNAGLLRVKSGLRTPTTFSPKSPSSPMFSPRLAQTTSGPGMPLNEAMKTQWLESKVKELEKALGGADKEMEEVVGRMNMAQIEVAELQSERDEALRRTRKLQAEINAEREKFKAMMPPA